MIGSKFDCEKHPVNKKKWNLYEHYIKIFQCYIYENRRCILYEKTMNKTNVFYMKNLWIKTNKLNYYSVKHVVKKGSKI